MRSLILAFAFFSQVTVYAQRIDSLKNTDVNSVLIDKVRSHHSKRFVLKEGRKVWIASSFDLNGKPLTTKVRILKVEAHQITFQSVANPSQQAVYADSTLRFIAFTTAGRTTVAIVTNTVLIGAGIAGCVLTAGVVLVQAALIVLYPVFAIFGVRGAEIFITDFKWVPDAFRFFGQLFKINVPLKKKFTFPDAQWSYRMAHT